MLEKLTNENRTSKRKQIKEKKNYEHLKVFIGKRNHSKGGHSPTSSNSESSSSSFTRSIHDVNGLFDTSCKGFPRGQPINTGCTFLEDSRWKYDGQSRVRNSLRSLLSSLRLPRPMPRPHRGIWLSCFDSFVTSESPQLVDAG